MRSNKSLEPPAGAVKSIFNFMRQSPRVCRSRPSVLSSVSLGLMNAVAEREWSPSEPSPLDTANFRLAQRYLNDWATIEAMKPE